ncbi:hypothetical protein MTO96_030790 [Rhipicephalus appendiculatus]
MGYVQVKVNWPEFHDVAEQRTEESAAFSTVVLERPSVSEKMNLVYVICENYFNLSIVAINVKKRVSCDVMPVWFPKEEYNQWRTMFRPCATQRLFLTRMLPYEDAILYVDTDVIFVHPIEDLWRNFYAMNEWQMAGMAPETEHYKYNHYITKALHPFVQPFALNAGLLMMNLTRMRTFHMENRVMRLKEEFKGLIPYADQDLLNIVFARYPQGIFTFTCRWNFRGEHCYGDALCTDGPIAAVHASREMFLSNGEPALVTLHQTMQNFKLGQKLVDDFILPLKKNLQKTTVTGCTKEFKKQLHLLRISASRVDKITAQASATNNT